MFWGDGHHFRNVEGGDTKGLGEAEFAVGLGRGVVGGSQSHVFAIENPYAFHAFDASTAKGHVLDNNCTGWVNLVVAHGAPFLS